MEKNAPDHVGLRAGDARYGGAADIVDAELDYVARRRATYGEGDGPAPAPRDSLVGLALSGGGIRSATFCLGVMQALAGHDWMRRVDYLSTVSGGGYIGSSLSWLLSRRGFSAEGGAESRFPFGTRDRALDNLRPESAEASPRGVLRWLRQNGKYLAPGDGITYTSFAAVCLRCIGLSVIVYFPLLVVLLYLLTAAGFFEHLAVAGVSRLFAIAGGVIALLAIAAIAYSVSSVFSGSTSDTAYRLRHWLETVAGKLLAFGLCVLVLGSVEPVSRMVDDLMARGVPALVLEIAPDAGTGAAGDPAQSIRITDARVGDLPVTGRVRLGEPRPAQAPGAPDERAESGGGSAWLGLISTVLGALGSVGVFQRGGTGGGRLPIGLVASLAAALLVYGLLLLSYDVSLLLLGQPGWLVLFVLVPVLVGWFTNLNFVSIHRYYRDRLMETFMPNVPLPSPQQGRQSRLATGANAMRLRDLVHEAKSPYHLINTNVVLVDSKQAKYRGRGGDGFVLSPLFCGCNATGWRATERYMEGLMNLPTAMAISGAAANPNTGVGGEGITRNVFVSFLMAFLNIRLGYWAPNPNEREHGGIYGMLAGLTGFRPNFLFPGVWELLAVKRLRETSAFIELTDGGHFENTGIYELVRRRCKLIIACDAAADPSFTFGDLANAMEKVRVDFGAKISLDVDALRPLVPEGSDGGGDPSARDAFAERGYVVAPIEYPAYEEGGEPEIGHLVYIKSTFTERQSGDVFGYRLANPSFPDQSTADQFFDEKQFEAYRELGFQLVHEMIRREMEPDGDSPACTELRKVAEPLGLGA